MTYSFNLRAISKEAAIDAAYEKLNQVAIDQPLHQQDVPYVQAAVASMVNALADADADVSVVASGYLNYSGTLDAPNVTGVSVQIAAHHVPREVASKT